MISVLCLCLAPPQAQLRALVQQCQAVRAYRLTLGHRGLDAQQCCCIVTKQLDTIAHAAGCNMPWWRAVCISVSPTLEHRGLVIDSKQLYSYTLAMVVHTLHASAYTTDVCSCQLTLEQRGLVIDSKQLVSSKVGFTVDTDSTQHTSLAPLPAPHAAPLATAAIALHLSATPGNVLKPSCSMHAHTHTHTHTHKHTYSDPCTAML